MSETTETVRPVSERLTAPPVRLPSHPLVAEWRPLTPADVDVAWEVQRAMDAVDHPNYLTTREEVGEDMGYSFVDLTQDSLVGFTADGSRGGGRPRCHAPAARDAGALLSVRGRASGVPRPRDRP